MKDLDPALREWLTERADANEREAFFDGLSAEAKDRFLAALHDALHATGDNREQAWAQATSAVIEPVGSSGNPAHERGHRGADPGARPPTRPRKL